MHDAPQQAGRRRLAVRAGDQHAALAQSRGEPADNLGVDPFGHQPGQRRASAQPEAPGQPGSDLGGSDGSRASHERERRARSM